ncbi:DUF1254 domain-containing protein [Flammeovirga agarivorans]|uniref:DUF1254 domain-containing protein n=1 Tax=Flammeovirga agarivorans TaxID=2726742 RepID=A0A7X8SID7_9BACT|nr:DUF1214 domain-containing protein [Flammeovirga agarivorans]NLR90682.1 DUF1254 domain-containing protein [Flammeovirga agarivorans]
MKKNILLLFTSWFMIIANCIHAQQKDIEYQIMVQRASQAAIWAMPAVGLVDFKKATRRDLGGDLNDVVYLTKPFDSKHGFLTANDVTAYGWGNIALENGPMVVEVPAASDKVSYFGSFLNAWQVPIEDIGPAGADKGEGGKYLLVANDYKGALPQEGYIIRYVDTYRVGFSFRPRLYNGATDKDAAEYAHQVKIYPLSEESNPKETNYLDATNVSYNCLPVYDFTFFQDINDVIQNNPVRPQDKAVMGILKSLGIEKGKEFNPSDKQKKAMEEGLALAYDYMQSLFTTPGKVIVEQWPGESNWYRWNFTSGQPQLGFPYETDNEVLIDGRAGAYFYITYLPKYLGGGTYYLTGLRDKAGMFLNGEDTYKLRVPKDTPVKDFWSVIVYSMKTKGFIQGAEKVGLSSRQIDELKKNKDGSVDIYFGPKPPKGLESNWIPTGEDFFLLFRLYGPSSKDFYKSWSLDDIEKVK